MLRSFSNNSSIVSTYDFARFKHIVDIGGGDGSFLVEILKCVPNARGTLFDAAPVVERAEAVIAKNNICDRCKTVSGDFFDHIPIEADCFVLKNVLHDWSDEKCLRILNNVKARMKLENKLVIIDSICEDEYSQIFDFGMWFTFGGKQRNLNEFKNLLSKAGFEITHVLTSPELPHAIIEATLGD
ncbi:hypothetical protein B4U79_16106 [Dinothrombium tinctorium]|uniref:Acetylserotonin O-methyltransferase n=1 Tax=Dinothrombium tinctorium TaxID=1965070 RepID=A0A443QXU2_9ACAR|nr:hypothetical protein B4U79_16106 [Dinothrombium tinctorium]